MSLRDLVDGECAGPSSLIRLTSHLIQDHAFQDEGLQNQRALQAPHEPPTAEQFVDQFLDEANNSMPQTFKMDNILREMKKIEYDPCPVGTGHPRHGDFGGYDSAWATQYLASGRHFDGEATTFIGRNIYPDSGLFLQKLHSSQVVVQRWPRALSLWRCYEDFKENQTDAIWNASFGTVSNNERALALQRNNSNELGLGPLWADEYLEHSVSLDNSIVINDGMASGEDNGHSAKEHSKLMKYMNRESDLLTMNNLQKSLNDDERLEQGTSRDGTLGIANNEIGAAEAWANELKDAEGMPMDHDKYESIFWARLQGEWNKISTLNNLVDSHPWLPEYEKYYDPFNEYKFHTENPMKSMNNALEEGKRRLEAGDLPSAVLCFEAAVQEDPKNAEAWLILGKTQAENEQDPLAICALKNSLQIDPTNSVALMTLAISYTNESYQNQACLTLKEWLSKHEKYKHLVVNSPEAHRRTESNVSTILFNDVHNEVKDMFIKAARINPREGIDPDVQSGLGVLFNLSCEYDKAADCFQAALNVRPDDCRLWNRYGATLANGQRSEEAVTAYHRALELSPGFIRARYNLGISCINLGAYKEAAEHLLTALNQQAAGRGVQGDKTHPGAMSDTIWSTLRLVLSLMHKYNLNEAVEARDLAAINREFEID